MIGDPVSALRQRLSAFFEKVRAGELLQIAPRDSMLSQPISPSVDHGYRESWSLLAPDEKMHDLPSPHCICSQPLSSSSL
jgi:hypothetical protein